MPFATASPTSSTSQHINNNQVKVLFFVPAHVDAIDIHHELTTRLAHCLTDSVEVRIATSAEKNIADSLTDYNILHIFGCWSNSARMLADKAYRKRVPYIITPLGMLQPWEMEKHSNKLSQRHQHRLTMRASAINVCGKLENETFTRLGWNNKVTLIKNPVLTSQTTFEEVGNEFLHLYRKVLDSNARVILGKDVQKAIGQLLQLGVDEQGFIYKNSKNELVKLLDTLSHDDWRYMFIYAYDEKVIEPISHALELLQYEYPRTDVESVDRFPMKTNYEDGPLKNDVLLSRNILLRNKVKETFANRGKAEQEVCLRILNLHYELNRHSAPLRHIADLYLDMRLTKMDEDMVCDMAKELDITEFSERLMAVMSDLLGLTEGFMPFNPKEGKSTRAIIKALTKYGQYPT